MEKMSLNHWLLLYITSKKCPKENSHPIGKKSPNLVTLTLTFLEVDIFELAVAA
jgi:hypothetical protein